METRKLYYEDSHLSRFTSAVLSCAKAADGWEVTLAATAFYPEGGGQAGDTGTLNGVRVRSTREREGAVIHLCEAPLDAGAEVAGVIDYDLRFARMQQHSGEHIVSGILNRRYGCHNTGFHMGADVITIDFDGVIPPRVLPEIEEEANGAVWQNLPVGCRYPSPEELPAIPYRSKKALAWPVRIVEIPGYDCCACCGTHVRRAGEVGIIKVLSCQKFREGVRLEILCGSRAYRYLSQVYDQDRAVAQLLSVKPQDTLAAAERQAEELAAAKQRMTELEDQLFSLRAQALTDRGDLLLLEPPTRPDGARKLADAAAKASGGLAAVFAGAESSYVYALVQADGADISPLVKRLNAALSGRGGGRNGFAQGSVQADRTAIYDFFRKEGIECPTC